SLRAIADRQAVEIIAAARRDAEVLRGEGEAQRSLIFANAYMQDQEFFDFYRSMQSYRTALGANGTTMVLSPETEFFRYFGSDQSAMSPVASTPAESAAEDEPGLPEGIVPATEMTPPEAAAPASEPEAAPAAQ